MSLLQASPSRGGGGGGGIGAAGAGGATTVAAVVVRERSVDNGDGDATNTTTFDHFLVAAKDEDKDDNSNDERYADNDDDAYDEHHHYRPPSQPTAKRKDKSAIPIHLYVLPVLLLEFLSISLTRAVLPSLLLRTFNRNVYVIMGVVEAIRGLLAFVSCPFFGKVSDVWGRKPCLFVTVLGTLLPVCSLALLPYDAGEVEEYRWRYGYDYYSSDDGSDYGAADMAATTAAAGGEDGLPAQAGGEFAASASVGDNYYVGLEYKRIHVFVFLLALSGLFSSTFTLTFAYISDAVKDKSDRVAAYGLALATFGLSFTVGPMAGGYLARVEKEDEVGRVIEGGEDGAGDRWSSGNSNDDPPPQHFWDDPAEEGAENASFATTMKGVHPLGQERVFTAALILAILDLTYVYFVLPETRRRPRRIRRRGGGSHVGDKDCEDDDDGEGSRSDEEEEEEDFRGRYPNDSTPSTTASASNLATKFRRIRRDLLSSSPLLPSSFRPLDALRVLTGDPLLSTVGQVAFLYYTSLWAVVSTLTLYAAHRFRLGPERLGELMSALGLSTMLAEAVLVRIVVPAMGEKRSMRLGLAAFAIQCAVLGVAYRGWHLFVCVALSAVSNLVYPSLTSLVSSAVRHDEVGGALGAVNAIKALTEGIGPLLFGTLMTVSERSAVPGWPYLLAACLAVAAYRRSRALPDDRADEDDDDVNDEYGIGGRGEGYATERSRWMARGASSYPSVRGKTTMRRGKRSDGGDGGARRLNGISIGMGGGVAGALQGAVLGWLGEERDRFRGGGNAALSELQAEEGDDELLGLLSEIDEDGVTTDEE